MMGRLIGFMLKTILWVAGALVLLGGLSVLADKTSNRYMVIREFDD